MYPLELYPGPTIPAARPCHLWPSDDDDNGEGGDGIPSGPDSVRSDDDGDHDDHENENGNANDDKNGNADNDDDDLGDRDGIPSGPEPVRRTSRRPFKAESSHASQYYLSQVYDDRVHED